jgi:hypothetical protein
MGVIAVSMLLAWPATAQFWGDPFARPRPPRAVPQQHNPFDFFQTQRPFWEQPQPQQPRVAPPRPTRAQMGDFSKAPPPRKPDSPPTTNVVVLGDAMADWLGHGLEEAFVDNPEFGVVRKIRANSGLIRGESRTDYDWVQSARELLAQEKPDFVVMMIGLSDRVSIRERAAARPAARPGQQAQPGQPAPQGQQKPQPQAGQQAQPGQQAAPGQQAQPGQQGQAGQPAQPGQGQSAEQAPPQVQAQESEGPTKPEQSAAEAGPTTAATHEFRSEKWGELYAKRIDETIAALKSKGVPVLWVGLPPIRGQRSRSDLSYLNDLYRARAQKAGIIYVDVWDGFVDEDGNFSLRGPDYNGQIRQLRSVDGLYFTKPGALKLGHYVEREIQRLMTARATPVALPTPTPEPQQTPAGAPTPGAPAPRPVAGPIVPLTGTSTAPEDLAGSGPARAAAPIPDPLAARVLVRGESGPAPAGRADDFSWPRPGVDEAAIIPVAATPQAAPTPQRPTKKGPPQKGQSDKGQAEKGQKRSGQSAASTPARPAR